MLLWLPRLLLWSFLIEFLFKFDEKCSSGCFASSCGHFLVTSYANLFQNDPLVALPPLVVASNSVLIQIRYEFITYCFAFLKDILFCCCSQEEAYGFIQSDFQFEAKVLNADITHPVRRRI